MSDSTHGSRSLAVTRCVIVFGTLVPYTLIQWLLNTVWEARSRAFKRWYYRQVCRAIGLRVEKLGVIAPAGPMLVVANHVSYFDIAALGALLDCSFISRADVRNWPVIGWSAAIQGTLFIDRDRRQIRDHRDLLAQRLGRDERLVLFPEGTSSDGMRVLPFKSALFSVAERGYNGKAVMVQPVTIAYTKLDGLPMGRYLRPLFAWYGDMTFFGHLFLALSMGVVTVVVEFHPPVSPESFSSRKALSEHCHRVIARGLSEILAGRRLEMTETARICAE